MRSVPGDLSADGIPKLGCEPCAFIGQDSEPVEMALEIGVDLVFILRCEALCTLRKQFLGNVSDLADALLWWEGDHLAPWLPGEKR